MSIAWWHRFSGTHKCRGRCVSSYTQIVLFWIIQTTRLGRTVQRRFGCEAA
jgi:hypothetical protein